MQSLPVMANCACRPAACSGALLVTPSSFRPIQPIRPFPLQFLCPSRPSHHASPALQPIADAACLMHECNSHHPAKTSCITLQAEKLWEFSRFPQSCVCPCITSQWSPHPHWPSTHDLAPTHGSVLRTGQGCVSLTWAFAMPGSLARIVHPSCVPGLIGNLA